jgi:putative ABC transport system permease protein
VEGLFGRGRRERELTAELESHLALHIDDNLRAGMTPEEARRQALIKLGGAEQTKQMYREQRGIPWLENLWLDACYGARMLHRAPGFTLVAVLTLALGIGATTLIFSVVYAAMLRSLPYPNAGSLVWIYGHEQREPETQRVSATEFHVLQRNLTALASIGAFLNPGKALRIGSESEWVPAATVTSGIFKTLGVHPVVGREFLPEEYRKGRQQEVLLSYRLWQERFDGKRDVLGRTVVVDLKPYTVVGVMPRGLDFPSRETRLWMPLVLPTGQNAYPVYVIGRLKAGASFAQVQAELNVIARRLSKNSSFPITLHGESLRSHLVGAFRLQMMVLLGAVGLLLLISCVGVANLLVARLSGRERETALRAALGATRARVLRQLLTESLLLSLVGGGGGVLLAFAGTGVLGRLLPENLSRFAPIRLNMPVLLFALGVSVISAVLFGLAPALFALRGDPGAALKGGQGGAVGTGSLARNGLRSWLVATEVALSTVLAVGGLLLFRSLLRLENVPTGLRTNHVLMLRAYLPSTKYKTPAEQREFYGRLLSRLAALPGVRSAAFDAILPFTGWGYAVFDIKGRRYPRRQEPRADLFQVSPGYFRTMRIPLLRGRTFRASDNASGRPVAVIDSEMARAYWPNQNPIGQQIGLTKWITIVGVVGHTRFLNLAKNPGPELYVPYDQMHPWAGGFVVHTAATPESLMPTVRRLVASLDPDVALLDLMTLRQRIAETIASRRLQTLLLGLFAGLALLLTAVGIAGVVSLAVSRRTREIGLRTALGAEPVEVIRLVLKGMLGVVAGGLIAGLAGALALSRFLESLLFGVARWDPASFVGTAALVLVVAMAASYVPARRAARVDPVVALREE